jgi:hypothetical protein
MCDEEGFVALAALTIDEVACRVISPQVQLGGMIQELSAPDDIAEDDVDITEENDDDGGIFF